MKKYLLTLALVVVFLAPSFAHAEETLGASCQTFSKSMTGGVVNIFKDKKSSVDQKKMALAQIFQSAVDTDWIGKFVVGGTWNKATPAQQAEYLKAYRDYLTMVYVSKLNDSDNINIDDIEVTSVTSLPGQGQFEAKTQIKRAGQPDVLVDYLLDQSSGKCQVHDIKVENISLLVSQRSEFASLASSGGIASVTAAIEKQNADN